jgi:GNAT superfamily N-acetyltransferase
VANIRRATAEDFPRLVELGHAMHQESPRFSKMPYSEEKIMTLLGGMCYHDNAIVLVAEREAEIVGMMLGFVAEQFFGPSKTASELVVYVTPEHRGGTVAPRLIYVFEDWAKWHGCAEIVLGVSTEVAADRTAKFYQRMGYAHSGHTLIKGCA